MRPEVVRCQALLRKQYVCLFDSIFQLHTGRGSGHVLSDNYQKRELEKKKVFERSLWNPRRRCYVRMVEVVVAPYREAPTWHTQAPTPTPTQRSSHLWVVQFLALLTKETEFKLKLKFKVKERGEFRFRLGFRDSGIRIFFKFMRYAYINILEIKRV